MSFLAVEFGSRWLEIVDNLSRGEVHDCVAKGWLKLVPGGVRNLEKIFRTLPTTERSERN